MTRPGGNDASRGIPGNPYEICFMAEVAGKFPPLLCCFGAISWKELGQVKKSRKSSSAEQSHCPDTTGLDSAWESLSVEMTSASYRDRLPTPHDDDPIRHYIEFSERSERPRDKMPTLRELDPLRYDLVP